jgi:dynamin 1-like protein
MSDTLRGEARYFADHPAYRALSGGTGTEVLSAKLNRILKELPALRTRVDQLIKDKEKEVPRYGDAPRAGSVNAHQLVISIMTIYCNQFSALVEGRIGDTIDDDLNGGARINPRATFGR